MTLALTFRSFGGRLESGCAVCKAIERDFTLTRSFWCEPDTPALVLSKANESFFTEPLLRDGSNHRASNGCGSKRATHRLRRGRSVERVSGQATSCRIVCTVQNEALRCLDPNAKRPTDGAWSQSERQSGFPGGAIAFCSLSPSEACSQRQDRRKGRENERREQKDRSKETPQCQPCPALKDRLPYDPYNPAEH